MSTKGSISPMDDYEVDLDDDKSGNSLFVISQVILILLILTLVLVIFFAVLPHKPSYYNQTIGNYKIELNSAMKWQRDSLSSNCEAYTGVTSNRTVCMVRVYSADSYNSTEELIESLREVYSNSEDYSGLSSVFQEEGYSSFNAVFMDGQNAQIRVYDKDTYISIVWVSSLDLYECVGNISKVED